jgi:hypothetical protein
LAAILAKPTEMPDPVNNGIGTNLVEKARKIVQAPPTAQKRQVVRFDNPIPSPG